MTCDRLPPARVIAIEGKRMSTGWMCFIQGNNFMQEKAAAKEERINGKAVEEKSTDN